jgi:STE24 endopeptidase
LEEKHGFNKTTPSLFVIDLVKGWGLAFVLGSPFLAVFLYIFQWAGDRFVPWLMAFMYVCPTSFYDILCLIYNIL